MRVSSHFSYERDYFFSLLHEADAAETHIDSVSRVTVTPTHVATQDKKRSREGGGDKRTPGGLKVN